MANQDKVRSCLIQALASAAGLDPHANTITDASVFDSLGIDSVDLYTITAELADLLGKDLEATLFWDHETLGEVIAAVAHDGVPLAVKGLLSFADDLTSPITAAVFCIPGIGGHPSAYRDLAQTLELPIPVAGLNFPGPGEAQATLVTPQGLASDLITRVREVQPVGPYRLIGHSYGGIVAFEMAQQLRANGEQLAFVGLLDAYLASGVQRLSFRRRLQTHNRRLQALTGKDRRRYLADRGLELTDRLFGVRGTRLLDATAPFDERLEALMRARSASWSGYVAEPFDGSVTLFRTTKPGDEGFFGVEPTSGWGEVVSDLDLVHIPGAHQDVLEPENLGELVNELRPRLLAGIDAPNP